MGYLHEHRMKATVAAAVSTLVVILGHVAVLFAQAPPSNRNRNS